MDYGLEVVAVPVSNVDAAKDFYERIGYHIDHDHRLSDELPSVQITPPGCCCSIVIGNGLTSAPPAAHRDSRSSSTTSRPHKRSYAAPASKSETSGMP
jgi:catechol 2,3-dioxygenase-like lactoylglutathione lyase family enzyme